MDIKAIWELNNKKVIISYLIILSTSAIIEIVFTNSFSYTFMISYLSLFFIAPYIRRALNEFFKNFHIKKVFRNLITSWLIFGIIYLYVHLFFISDFLVRGTEYLGFNPLSNFLFLLILVILILSSINPLIRIIAVAYHRRKSNLYPINRIEYASLFWLTRNDENTIPFMELKEKIKGTFNIFIPSVFFDEEIATASIYLLCGLRLADITNGNVKINYEGK